MAVNFSEYLKSLFGGINTDMPDNVTFAGAVASKANAATIAHGLGVAPTIYGVTATVSGHIAVITAADATNLTLGLKTDAGVDVAVAENVVWFARR
jgi:hypothetical protein